MNRNQSPPSSKIRCGYCYKNIDRTVKYCPSCGHLQKLVREKQARITFERRWKALEGIIVFYVILLATSMFVLWLNQGVRVYGLLVASGIDALLISGYAVINRGMVFSLFGFNKKVFSYILLGILSLFPLIVINMLYHEGLQKIFTVKEVLITDLFAKADLGVGWVIFSLCLMPAIWEEIAFRGIIQGKFSQLMGIRAGILYSSLLFAIIHVAYLSVFYLFFLGLVLGYLRLRSSSLWPGILLHFAHNLIVVVFEYHHISIFG